MYDKDGLGTHTMEGVRTMTSSDKFNRSEMLTENTAAFRALLPTLSDKAGKFVLMRDRMFENFFDSAADAHLFANEKCPDGRYSVHEVRFAPADLGYFSGGPVRATPEV